MIYRIAVEEIVLVYMKHADVKTALECIKVFAFEELLDISSNKGRCCPIMCHDVRFVIGGTGGVVIVRVGDNHGFVKIILLHCNLYSICGYSNLI